MLPWFIRIYGYTVCRPKYGYAGMRARTLSREVKKGKYPYIRISV
jgi:hypothetical protein